MLTFSGSEPTRSWPFCASVSISCTGNTEWDQRGKEAEGKQNGKANRNSESWSQRQGAVGTQRQRRGMWHTVATATTAFMASFSAETGASSTFCSVDFFFSGLPPAAGFLP